MSAEDNKMTYLEFESWPLIPMTLSIVTHMA